MVSHNQDRMFQSDNRLLLTPTSCDAMILGLQIGILGARSCMSRLVQSHSQSVIAFGGFA